MGPLGSIGAPQETTRVGIVGEAVTLRVDTPPGTATEFMRLLTAYKFVTHRYIVTLPAQIALYTYYATKDIHTVHM